MGDHTVPVTDSDFQAKVTQAKVPVLVDFWAPWCGPCLSIGPTLEALAEEYKGKVVVAKLNVDDNPDTAAEFGVRSIPFLAMVRQGKVVDSIVGAVPKAKIKDMIDRAMNAPAG